MPHKLQPVSVADIHDIYGAKRSQETAATSVTAPAYRKSSFSVREAGHPGEPPPRQPPNVKPRNR
jgi:hypothetical protein